MFRRPTVRYGATPEPETPYQRAGQAWDDRIGSARVQARNWRLAFFGALLISGGLAAGLVWQSVRGTVTPWVVQIDKLVYHTVRIAGDVAERCVFSWRLVEIVNGHDRKKLIEGPVVWNRTKHGKVR